MTNKLTPFIMFKKDGKKAIDLYTKVFKDAKVHSIATMPDSDQLLHASFTINGLDFLAMDGGEYFTFSEGISLFIECKDQDEVDYYWDALTANSGEPGQCGWLKDPFGISWQVVPTRLGELLNDPDQEKSGRAMQAMLKMKKLVIADLEAAAEGK